jgi:hypothetical protein
VEYGNDNKDHRFAEIEMENGEKVRVTIVEESWSSGPGVRIQVRQKDGHLRQGPEIPAAVLGEVVSAVINLVRR